ncbi:hypothetical protein CLV98_101346 [Dyadobacter jejuensis]|uniref:Uncharacterized protein n=1 Tax=Dyadobacter jejuensis TaxID=1082580 RepID=A0A316AS90_9BACT|nr:hypothetical protein [Dyadobacter jejuensis]PWJ60169.1 hypothetical protein CLV98_101346 [Dyadobacter jejuensis]
MKKHPIDEIFKDKLGHLPKEPSAQAWEKLSGRMSQSTKRRPPYWWYAAAASLLLGALLWGNMSLWTGTVAPPLGVSESEKVMNRPIEEEPTVVPLTAEGLSKEPAQAPSKPRENAMAEPLAIAHTGHNPVKPDLQKEKAPEVKEPLYTEKVAVIAKPKLEQIDLEADLKLPKTIVPEDLEDNAPANRVILVQVEEPTATEADRNGRLGRLFKQLKNVKSGEPVNWDQVGIDPKSILARVDDRLVGSENIPVLKNRRIKQNSEDE